MAGLLLTIDVEELLVSAHDILRKESVEKGPLARIMLVVGFALFMVIGTYFEL
jgi:zinc transporter ZupT